VKLTPYGKQYMADKMGRRDSCIGWCIIVAVAVALLFAGRA
jgi:hypothetical protein